LTKNRTELSSGDTKLSRGVIFCKKKWAALKMIHETLLYTQESDRHRAEVIGYLHSGWNKAARIAQDLFMGCDSGLANLYRPDNHDHGIDHSGRVAQLYAWGSLSVVELLRISSHPSRNGLNIKAEAIFGGQVAAFAHDIGFLVSGSREKHAETGAIILADRIRPAIESGDISDIAAYAAVASTYFHSFENATAHARSYHRLPPLDFIEERVNLNSHRLESDEFIKSLEKLRENNWLESVVDYPEVMSVVSAASRRVTIADERDSFYPFSNARAMITFPNRPAYSGEGLNTSRGIGSENTRDDLTRILGETTRDFRPIAAVPEMKALRTLKLEKMRDLKTLVRALSEPNNSSRRQRVSEYLGPKLNRAQSALSDEINREGGIPSRDATVARHRLEHFGNLATQVLSDEIKRIPPNDLPSILSRIDWEIDWLKARMLLFGAYGVKQAVNNTVVVADWKI
jgi:hypothetical protein